MKRYLVIREETCPVCKGTGENTLKSSLPSELARCPECKGDVIIRKEVDLFEALKELQSPDFDRFEKEVIEDTKSWWERFVDSGGFKNTFFNKERR